MSSMRDLINIVEAASRVAKERRHGEYTLRFGTNQQGDPHISVVGDGNVFVGSAWVGHARSYNPAFDKKPAWSVMHIWINPEFRNQGIASAIYDFFYDLGFRPLVPDRKQLPDGEAFWKAHQNKKFRLGKPLPKWEWVPERRK